MSQHIIHEDYDHYTARKAEEERIEREVERQMRFDRMMSKYVLPISAKWGIPSLLILVGYELHRWGYLVIGAVWISISGYITYRKNRRVNKWR